MPELVEQCGTCRFFLYSPGDTLQPLPSPLPPGARGWCRESPPSMPIHGGGARPWPTLDASDWCGKYRPAASTATTPPPAAYTDFTPRVSFGGYDAGLVCTTFVARHATEAGFVSLTLAFQIVQKGTSTGELWIDGAPPAAVIVPCGVSWVPGSFVASLQRAALRANLEATGRIRLVIVGEQQSTVTDAALLNGAVLSFSGTYAAATEADEVRA